MKVVRELVKSIKSWKAAVLLLTLALLVYYAVLGFQFLNFRADERWISDEIGQLSEIVNRPSQGFESLELDLKKAERELEKASAFYGHNEGNNLLVLITDTARDAGVTLERLEVGETEKERVGYVSYSLRHLKLRIRSGLEELFSFLHLLDQRAVMSKITEVSLWNLHEEPIAELQVVFYLSPQYMGMEEA